jgi:type IV pilus assembly protein PilE
MPSVIASTTTHPPRHMVSSVTVKLHARLRGFTLIEVMIVVAVVAVLASIALPSYQEHVRKSRRVDAQAAMLELAQAMERAYTINNAYPDTLPAGVADRVANFYTLTLSAQTAQTYTLQAVPTAKQSADSCSTLTLTHTGARTPGTAGCWN